MMRHILTLRAAALGALAALLALPAALTTAQQAPDHTLTDADNGTTIQVRVDDVLQVELPEDPTGTQIWLLVPTETFDRSDVIIGDVWAVGPAARAGFAPGDQILELDGEPVESTLDLAAALEEKPGETVPVVVQRGDEQLTLDLTLEAFDTLAIERPILTDFMDNMPAAEAGFEIGDVLLQVDGQDITSISALQATIGARKGEPVTITVMRGAEKLDISVTPQTDPDGFVRIGISIIALDYSLAGLGVADLNVESYLGVQPFRPLIPMPTDVPRRFKLAQIGDPQSLPGDDPDSPGLSVWQFEAVSVGETRLTLVHLDPNLETEEIGPEQFFEVWVQVAPALGPAA